MYNQLGNSPLLPVAGNQIQSISQGTLDIPLDPTLRASYDNIFFQLVGRDTSASLSGANAKSFFLKSNLPQSVLAQIWSLSDINGDGTLDREEFAIAYHLCQAAIKGYSIPSALPRHLVPQSKAMYYMSNAVKQEDWVTLQNTVNFSTSVEHQQVSSLLQPHQSPQYSYTTTTPTFTHPQSYGTHQQSPYGTHQQHSQYSLPQQSQIPQSHKQHSYSSLPVQHAVTQSQYDPFVSQGQHAQSTTNPPQKLPHPQVSDPFSSAPSNNLFFDGTSTDSTGQLVFVPAPVEVKGRDVDASNTYALGAGVSFEQRIALTTELGDAMKKMQQKKS